MFGPYKEMWKEAMEFKSGYDEHNPGLWSKILFWGVCIWTVLKTIPVTLIQMFYFLYNKGIHLYAYLLYRVKSVSPWSKAQIFLCWNKYTESMWYRERLVIMGEKYTVQRFIDGDWKFFRNKLTRKEKWGMIFCPFTYIEKNIPWITCDIGDLQ